MPIQAYFLCFYSRFSHSDEDSEGIKSPEKIFLKVSIFMSSDVL